LGNKKAKLGKGNHKLLSPLVALNQAIVLGFILKYKAKLLEK
jgi:hypothetical protein